MLQDNLAVLKLAVLQSDRTAKFCSKYNLLIGLTVVSCLCYCTIHDKHCMRMLCTLTFIEAHLANNLSRVTS